MERCGSMNVATTIIGSLADLSAHVKVMDRAGIDMAVLSCGSGFDQPNVATCKLINDHLHQAQCDY